MLIEFRSRKDFGAYIILTIMISSFLALLFIGFQQDSFFEIAFVIPFLLALVSVVLFLHLFSTTYYTIENKALKYHCSIFYKGEIGIDKIIQIKKSWSPLAGIRPALAFKGLIITFNKYDEIYVSPKRESEFIEEILKINENVKVE